MRVEKLICIDETNHNKVYEMHQLSSDSWVAKYGRVGAALVETTYPMSQFDKKYREKIRKGYKPITELVTIAVASTNDNPFASVDMDCREVLEFLQSCARDAVKKNYTIAASAVTEKQIAKAQAIIDALMATVTAIDNPASVANDPGWSAAVIASINAQLLELYCVIPRKMAAVKAHLAHSIDNLKDIISNEQSLLDTMATQVQASHPQMADQSSALPFSIRKATDAEKKEITGCTDLDLSKVRNVYAVTHFSSLSRYQSVGVSNEKLLVHGSRNENWLNILMDGFKVKPANAVHTGSMYGLGLYLANKVRKAIGYTSLSGSYWARGASNKAFIALLSTNCGRMWDVHSTEGGHRHWMTSLTEDKCKQKGYDSVFAAKGVDLRNDEFVVYNGNRVTIKYLVELKEGN